MCYVCGKKWPKPKCQIRTDNIAESTLDSVKNLQIDSRSIRQYNVIETFWIFIKYKHQIRYVNNIPCANKWLSCLVIVYFEGSFILRVCIDINHFHSSSVSIGSGNDCSFPGDTFMGTAVLGLLYKHV